jgi:hypothetical protein
MTLVLCWAALLPPVAEARPVAKPTDLPKVLRLRYGPEV